MNGVRPRALDRCMAVNIEASGSCWSIPHSGSLLFSINNLNMPNDFEYRSLWSRKRTSKLLEFVFFFSKLEVLEELNEH